MTSQHINQLIQEGVITDVEHISDGYHTFKELYDHRIQLWIALCNVHNGMFFPSAWRTLRHSDGELAFGGGWMVLGIGMNAGEQMTYHLPESYWDQCDFAKTLDKAPEFDGHTAEDVLERLKSL